jgi:hypothetical protein
MRLRDSEIDAGMMAVYFEALADYRIEPVRDAAIHWAKTGRFFPTTGEWCSLVEEMREAVPAAVWRPTVTVLCEACADTGWVYKDCTAGQRCGQPSHLQRGSAYSHTYVARCACFTSEPSNPG